jgi:hypothetical protein
MYFILFEFDYSNDYFSFKFLATAMALVTHTTVVFGVAGMAVK